MSLQLNIAVVGGGIAGIAAAHRLAAKHSVTLFEASPVLGGHAHSHSFDLDGRQLTVDTAFLIFNTRTYPLFCAFLHEIGVDRHVLQAEMSSCFSSDEISYTLGLPDSLIRTHPCQFFNLNFLSIFFDLWRFRKQAAQDCELLSALKNRTIGDYLRPYGNSFRENFAFPLMAAIWSLPLEDVERHPASSILSYFSNHSLLHGKSDRLWQTLYGSSKVYIDAFLSKFSGKIVLNCPIQKVQRAPRQCVLNSADGDYGPFDRVVIATHADTALSLLDSPSDGERKLLSVWKYREQVASLHSDARVLHPNPNFWASWNMRRSENEYRISYYLNRLQRLPVRTPVILSLGEQNVDESLVISKHKYRHPVFDHASVKSQRLLPALNEGITSFCGSYFGFGFHEDAFRSGVAAAELLSR